ncbi:MAG: class I SAM-dependent methyltransferase [Candidatus Acidiferrales bacterium]
MSEAETKAHWEDIYRRLPADAVSWYKPHLKTSLEMIERVGRRDASIIDVGGGESTLVDDLLARGYEHVTVLDISETALAESKKRLGEISGRAQWMAADVTTADFERAAYDVWHDRAVFHFLTAPEKRAAYVRNVARAVKPGGHVIVGTFGPEGPTKCSGLDVVRYDAEQLHGEFGLHFRPVESREELHATPAGKLQQFLYCLCRVE